MKYLLIEIDDDFAGDITDVACDLADFLSDSALTAQVIYPIDKQVATLLLNDAEAFTASVTMNLCSLCGEPQYRTPSGDVCKNGHGGADPL